MVALLLFRLLSALHLHSPLQQIRLVLLAYHAFCHNCAVVVVDDVVVVVLPIHSIHIMYCNLPRLQTDNNALLVVMLLLVLRLVFLFHDRVAIPILFPFVFVLLGVPLVGLFVLVLVFLLRRRGYYPAPRLPDLLLSPHLVLSSAVGHPELPIDRLQVRSERLSIAQIRIQHGLSQSAPNLRQSLHIRGQCSCHSNILFLKCFLRVSEL